MDEEGQEIVAFLNTVDMVGVEELDPRAWTGWSVKGRFLWDL